MIVFVLALAAGGLLASGILLETMAYTYASLGVGVVALTLVAASWLYGRRAAGAAADARRSDEQADSRSDDTTDTADASRAPLGPKDETAADANDDEDTDDTDEPGSDDAGSPLVIVIPGRKRFHQRDCRHLHAREHQEITLEEALEEGFSACMTCSGTSAARRGREYVGVAQTSAA